MTSHDLAMQRHRFHRSGEPVAGTRGRHFDWSEGDCNARAIPAVFIMSSL
ncbi:MAG: hypothetical protein ABIR36_04725 [Nitrospiraceae bacterium]